MVAQAAIFIHFQTCSITQITVIRSAYGSWWLRTMLKLMITYVERWERRVTTWRLMVGEAMLNANHAKRLTMASASNGLRVLDFYASMQLQVWTQLVSFLINLINIMMGLSAWGQGVKLALIMQLHVSFTLLLSLSALKTSLLFSHLTLPLKSQYYNNVSVHIQHIYQQFDM